MRRGMRAGVGALTAAVLLLGACSDDDGSDGAEGSTTSTADGDASGTTEGTLAPPFEDDTYFGFVVDVDFETDGGPYVEFDVARLHTGEDAAQAQEDGVAGCEEAIDYCIEDPDDTVRLVPVAADVAVRDIDISGDCCEPKPGDLETFAADRNPPRTPAYLVIEGAKVVRIDEVYFP